MKSRILSAISTDQIFEVRVRRYEVWAAGILLAAYLAVVGILASLFASVASASEEGSTVPGWPIVLPWVLVPTVAVLFLSRHLFVEEIITLSKGVLTLKRSYVVFTSSKSFRVEEVENLRNGGLDDGTIEFEVGGRTHYLRNRLREQTARTLVEELNGRMQSAARR